MQSDNPGLLEVALGYVASGLRVLPACAVQKRPTLSRFKYLRKTRPTDHQHQVWFAAAKAICVLTGEASGNLEVLDFDQAGRAFGDWCRLVETRSPSLLDRLVIQRSQSGGRHVIYRLSAPGPGSTVLARSAATDHRQGEVLIETRGEGGLVMCAPSPGYELLQGKLTDLAVIDDGERAVLIEAAKSLHAGPVRPPQTDGERTGYSDGSLPGDEFNRRGDIRAVLQRHGWRQLRAGENEQWCRPGKSDGCSATLKEGVFYVFSSNAVPFDPNRGYAPFAVYAMLEHGGDFSAATKELRDQGYGTSDGSSVDLSGFSVTAKSEPNHAAEADAAQPDPGPVPEAMLRIPGFVSELMDHCLDTAPYPNPTLAFCGALALLATLAGRKVRDPGDNRTNLYLLGLAHSAAGKDWPRKLNVRILHRIGMAESIGERFASGEGIQDALFTTPSMLFQTDEIDGILQSMNKAQDGRHENILSTLLTMYSSANSVYPMRRKAGKEAPGAIDQPSLVIFGTAIPNHYYEALSERMLTNGFFARMMILECGQRGCGQEPKIAEVPERIMEVGNWWSNYEPGRGNLGPWHPVPAIVPHDDEARSLLIDARRRAETEYDKAESANDPVGTTVWGRVNEQTRKLSLLYAVSVNHLNPVIDQRAARWATDLVDHLTRRMLFMASSHVADSPFDADCLRVVSKLRKAEGRRMPHSELLKRMKMDARKFGELISTMEQRREIAAVSTATAGRPTREYELLVP